MASCSISGDRSDQVQADALKQLPDFDKSKSFLDQSSFPVRTGNPPDCETCLPHAQMTQQSPDNVFDVLKERAVELLGSYVTIGRSTVSMPSTYPAFHLVCQEPTSTSTMSNKHHQAPMPQEACMTPGGPRCGSEFAHIHTRYHPPDSEFAKAHEGERWQAWQGGGQGSMHLCLALQDAAQVLEKGWAERHLLAGEDMKGMLVPRGLVLLYAPRTVEEVDVVLNVLHAALQFARDL